MNDHGPERGTEPGLQPVPTRFASYVPSVARVPPIAAVPLTLRQLADQFEALFQVWEDAGHSLYLVGGCVRDVLMQRDEIGDIDLTTDARPEETTAMLERAGFPAYPIGARFGTISTIVDGVPVEITTFRVEETYEAGSRKPHVIFGESLEHDLSRRDLSINAMAAGRHGTLFDPFRGRDAIAARILEVPRGGFENTVGILRDDPLRLLRIGRFCARFAFTPTDQTTDAAKVTADELQYISHERWKMELDKTLIAPHMTMGLRWLNEVGAFGVLFPSFHHRLDEANTLIARLGEMSDDRIARWAALFLAAAWMQAKERLPDLRLPADERADLEHCGRWAMRAARHFRFSNEEREMVRRLCMSSLDEAALSRTWTRMERRRYLAEWGGLYRAALEVAQAFSQVDAAHYAKLQAELDHAFVCEDVTVRLPHGFGKSVLEKLKVPRGPKVAQTIAYVQQAIVDGELPNGAPEELYLEFLRARLAEESNV